MKRYLLRHHRLLVVMSQLVAIASAMLGAFLLRFDFTVPPAEMAHLRWGIGAALVLKTVVFALAGLQSGWWRFAGLPDLFRILSANMAGSAGFAVLTLAVVGTGFPRSIYLIDFLLCFLVTAAGRFAVRFYYEVLRRTRTAPSRSTGVLIYGAGFTGVALAKELRAKPELGYSVLGFLDDDPGKRGARFVDVAVLGAGGDAAGIVEELRLHRHKVSEIVIAMPSASGRAIRAAVEKCRAAQVPVKTVPGLRERLSGKVLTAQLRNIEISDLLGRDVVSLDTVRIGEHIGGRAVLVTGGAGSIGSELCRQITAYRPASLVVLDHAESDIFRIDRELRDRFPEATVIPVIASIRDAERVEEILRDFEIEAVFHAAAYKHVPLMESHIREAVQNNVLGTLNVVKAAQKLAVPDLLMISSDKAVNPTSIMGVTKRVAELIVAAYGAGSRQPENMRWVSVRFGNVLGSNGSVVPIFQSQILAGGPVTVTHPDVTRYFMTIPEAVQLVLQAAVMGHAGDIFVLDMGEPVRIVDLARHMIQLSGLKPDEDIAICFTGLRPGEKLFEELVVAGEHIQPTTHEKVKRFTGPGVTEGAMSAWLQGLGRALDEGDDEEMVEHLRKLVPEYRPAAIRPRFHTAVRTKAAGD